MGARPFIAVTTAALALCAVPVSADAVCSQRVVHDYEAELPQPPPGREGKLRQGLPFAPESIVFGRRFQRLINPDPRTFGYRLVYNPPRPGEHLSPELDWNWTVRIGRVEPNGKIKPLRRLRHRVTQLVSRRGRSGGFSQIATIEQPGLYKVESEFRSFEGERLGRYVNFAEILEPHRSTLFSLDGSVFRPGDTLAPTLLNTGTTDVVYGYGERFERRTGDVWAPYELVESHPVPMIAFFLPPGYEAFGCWDVQIPADAAPGTYRIMMAGEGETRTSADTVEFQIVAP